MWTKASLVIRLGKRRLSEECLVCFLFGTTLVQAILKAFAALLLALDKFMLVMSSRLAA